MVVDSVPTPPSAPTCENNPLSPIHRPYYNSYSKIPNC
jgi:hypothetical protein